MPAEGGDVRLNRVQVNESFGMTVHAFQCARAGQPIGRTERYRLCGPRPAALPSVRR